MLECQPLPSRQTLQSALAAAPVGKVTEVRTRVVDELEIDVICAQLFQRILRHQRRDREAHRARNHGGDEDFAARRNRPEHRRSVRGTAADVLVETCRFRCDVFGDLTCRIGSFFSFC